MIYVLLGPSHNLSGRDGLITTCTPGAKSSVGGLENVRGIGRYGGLKCEGLVNGGSCVGVQILSEFGGC